MKKLLLISLIIFSLFFKNEKISAQSAGINATGAAPNASAGLDIDFSNKGLLVPRVALTSSTDASTITSPATSLLVYNLGTGGLTPAGYYYNSGTSGTPVWQLLNSGINVQTDVSSATPTPASSTDIYTITALAANAAFAAPTGTPAEGHKLTIRIKDNGTARMLSWNAIYRRVGAALPTTTIASQTLYLNFIYNSADNKWDLLSSAQQIAPPAVTVKALVVGGGGGGGNNTQYDRGAGGGGAGGYQYNAALSVTAQAYPVVVGAGGGGGSAGNNSSFSTITAYGGGAGGLAYSTGGNGASGGGGGSNFAGGTGTQGFNGGTGSVTNPYASAGGGGSSAAGANGSGGSGGSGGAGTSNSISGSAVVYAGGGGAGATSYGAGLGSGGSGGGASGASSGSGNDATPNTGGGGGAGSFNAAGGSGGSGIVIISYVTADFSAYAVTGGTITTSGANTIHTFTSDGTFTINF